MKEEIPDPDVKGSPHLSDSGCLGQQREGGGTELVGTVMTSNTPERTGQGGAGVAPLLVKEEPKEDNGLPTSFTLNAADRSANHTKPKDPSEFVPNSTAALFSQDISVKMASDFLMKLSGTCLGLCSPCSHLYSRMVGRDASNGPRALILTLRGFPFSFHPVFPSPVFPSFFTFLFLRLFSYSFGNKHYFCVGLETTGVAPSSCLNLGSY